MLGQFDVTAQGYRTGLDNWPGGKDYCQKLEQKGLDFLSSLYAGDLQTRIGEKQGEKQSFYKMIYTGSTTNPRAWTLEFAGYND